MRWPIHTVLRHRRHGHRAFVSSYVAMDNSRRTIIRFFEGGEPIDFEDESPTLNQWEPTGEWAYFPTRPLFKMPEKAMRGSR